MSVKVRERKLTGSSVRIYLDIYEGGARKLEKLFTADKSNKEMLTEYRRMAKIVASKRELELQAKENGVVPLTKQRKDLLTFFQEVMDIKSGSTRDSYHSTLLQLRAFAAKKKVSVFLFSDVSVQWFEEFKRFLSEKLAKKTVQVYGSLVKHVLRLAARNGHLQLALLEQFKVEKAPQHKRDYLTLPELEALSHTEINPVARNGGVAEVYDEEMRAFFFGVMTGLRYSDLQKLTFADIKGDFNGGDDRVEFIQKKTSEDNSVCLNPTAKAIIAAQREARTMKPLANDKVFQMHSATASCNAFRRWFKAAGVKKKCGWHIARHSNAMLLLNAKVSIYTVSKLLGHTELSTTEIYLQLIEEEKRDAASRLPVIQLAGLGSEKVLSGGAGVGSKNAMHAKHIHSHQAGSVQGEGTDQQFR